MSRGVVAAGHPETAEAGAWALREGGNAVDAAVAAVAASLATESPLTGLGAGGYMLIHDPGASDVLLDFFVAAPGRSRQRRFAELVSVDVDFGDTIQVFHIGAASCGVPGVPAGLAAACERFGSMPLSELVGPGVRLAREGVEMNAQQTFLLKILAPILIHEPEGREIYAPEGRLLSEGERFHWPELATALERLGEEGATPFYRGDIARRICDFVRERGGALAPEDLAAYRPIARAPVEARFAGRRILTNPPPSSGGILIAYALDILERVGSHGVEALVAAMEESQAARTRGFLAGLYEEGFAREFLSEDALAQAASRTGALLRAGEAARRSPEAADDDLLGSTTHLTAIDAEGRCASVTCSNGTGSGLLVPETGVHVNNMLGEEDLNPLGFHQTAAGRRMPSMMAPTVVLRDGGLELGLGSGGSNRIRSAITQTILRLVGDGIEVGDAVRSPRVHFEGGAVHAEPGVDPEALDRLERSSHQIVRWGSQNLFFGGVHAVARDPATGEMIGGGDPRRGGAVAVA